MKSEEIAALETWVKRGAVFPAAAKKSSEDAAKHWAFQPVGKVDVPALVDLFEKAGNDMMIMVELDPNLPDPRPLPMTPLASSTIAKECLHKLGYAFRV